MSKCLNITLYRILLNHSLLIVEVYAYTVCLFWPYFPLAVYLITALAKFCFEILFVALSSLSEIDRRFNQMTWEYTLH